MDLPTLLASLRRRGIRVWLENGRPRLEPAEALTPEDWDAIRPHAVGLAAALALEAQASVPALKGAEEPPWLWREVRVGGKLCMVYGTSAAELAANVQQARRLSGVWENTEPLGLEKVFLR